MICKRFARHQPFVRGILKSLGDSPSKDSVYNLLHIFYFQTPHSNQETLCFPPGTSLGYSLAVQSALRISWKTPSTWRKNSTHPRTPFFGSGGNTIQSITVSRMISQRIRNTPRSMHVITTEIWPVVILSANGDAAFIESCAHIGWKDCDSVISL